jgi:hypothetical protein
MKTNKILRGLGLLAITLPAVVFAQVITHPANDVGSGGPDDSHRTLYLILGAVVVLAVGGFLVLRSKGSK